MGDKSNSGHGNLQNRSSHNRCRIKHCGCLSDKVSKNSRASQSNLPDARFNQFIGIDLGSSQGHRPGVVFHNCPGAEVGKGDNFSGSFSCSASSENVSYFSTSTTITL